MAYIEYMIIMTKKDTKSTIILNKIKSDDFLDFSSSYDLKQIIEVLSKIMDD